MEWGDLLLGSVLGQRGGVLQLGMAFNLFGLKGLLRVHGLRGGGVGRSSFVGRVGGLQLLRGSGVALTHALLPLVVEGGGGGDLEIRKLCVVVGLTEGNAVLRCHLLYLHHCHTGSDDAEFLGCTPREVDDAATDERSAVGDAHNDFLAVGGVFHTQECAEGIGAVGTGEAVVVQPLTVGGAGTRGTLGVEGSLAFLHRLCEKPHPQPLS